MIDVIFFAAGVLLGAWLTNRARTGALSPSIVERPFEDGDPIPDNQMEPF
jgi:hypothetical protein